MSNEIEQMEKTIDANTEQLLQASIAIMDLSKNNQRLNAQNTVMKVIVREFLSSFEARFDRDPDQFVTEECYEYMDAAKFMERHFGRVNNYIVAVSIYLQNKKV